MREGCLNMLAEHFTCSRNFTHARGTQRLGTCSQNIQIRRISHNSEEKTLIKQYIGAYTKKNDRQVSPNSMKNLFMLYFLNKSVSFFLKFCFNAVISR